MACTPLSACPRRARTLRPRPRSSAKTYPARLGPAMQCTRIATGIPLSRDSPFRNPDVLIALTKTSYYKVKLALEHRERLKIRSAAQRLGISDLNSMSRRHKNFRRAPSTTASSKLLTSRKLPGPDNRMQYWLRRLQSLIETCNAGGLRSHARVF